MTIKVINHQTIDNDTDIIEENGCGTIHVKNGRIYIIYDVVTEEGSSKVTIFADNDCVKIKRDGEYSTTLVYDAKKTTSIRYATPYGGIDMEIRTHQIHNGLTERGGILKLVYTLVMQGMSTYNDTDIIVG